MTRSRLIHGFVVLIAICSLVALGFVGRVIPSRSDGRVEQQLQRLIQYDAALNETVLQVRSGLLQHYDPLVQTSTSMTRLLAELRDSSSGTGDFEELTKQYSQLAETRLVMTERFKAKNAILKNSLFYFPTAATLFVKRAQEANAAAPLSIAAEKLLQDLLTFYVNGNANLESRVKSHLHELGQLSDDAPESLERELNALMKHASIVLWHKKAVDDLLRRITSVESAAVLSSLIHVHELQARERQHTAELNRAGLYAGATLLLCYMAILFAAWRRAKRGRSPDESVLEQRARLVSSQDAA